MIAHSAPAGVPDGLSPEELERWSNELVAFLTSGSVPASLRGWARVQADRLDAYMASAEDLDAQFDESEDEDDVAPAPAAPARQASPRAVTPPRHAAAVDAPQQRDIVLRVPEQVGKLGAGIIIGALALLAIFGVRALAGGGSSALPTSAPTATVFNQQRADELQTLLQQNPADKAALFELGEMTFEAGRFEDSIFWLTKLVTLDPANTLALNDIGTANFNLQRPDEAKVWWQKTLAVNTNDVQAHYNMGFVYANAEPRDLAGAVNEWEAVVRLDPASQLGQTAKVHVDGLRAQLAATPAAGGALPTQTATAAVP